MVYVTYGNRRVTIRTQALRQGDAMMNRIGAEMSAAVLGGMLEAEVSVVAVSGTVVAWYVQGAGFLLLTKPGFSDDDWDAICRQLPPDIYIDYADDCWSVIRDHPLITDGAEMFFAGYVTPALAVLPQQGIDAVKVIENAGIPIAGAAAP